MALSLIRAQIIAYFYKMLCDATSQDYIYCNCDKYEFTDSWFDEISAHMSKLFDGVSFCVYSDDDRIRLLIE